MLSRFVVACVVGMTGLGAASVADAARCGEGKPKVFVKAKTPCARAPG